MLVKWAWEHHRRCRAISTAAESADDCDLLLGSFTTFRDLAGTIRSNKDEIEDKVKAILETEFGKLNVARVRTEVFAVRPDLYYRFNRDVGAARFCHDYTAQLLLYTRFMEWRVRESDLGTYLDGSDYSPEREQHQIARAADLVQLGRSWKAWCKQA